MKFVCLRTLLTSALYFALVACSSPTVEPPVVGGDNAGINGYLRDLPAWETPRVQNIDDRKLEEGALTVDDTTYDCTADTRQLDPEKTTYQEIMLAGINENVLYPGSLLQGDDIEQGLLRGIPLARSPITMTISLNVEDPSITVASPTTATMRNAVSELIRRADTRLGEIDVVPGNIFYNKVESHSYEQSLNEVGISAGYDDKIKTKVDASFNFGSERRASSHTITVYLVEPLFSLEFSDDTLREPADLFAKSVTKADLLQEEAAGRMGADNLPVYVQKVNYGRVLMYTLTSTEVDSFERLAAAVSASHGAFSGGATYTQEDRNILSNSQETLIAFGGSQEASNAAILDLNKFFVPLEATQAVPISYEIRNLNRGVAKVGDITEYKVQDCNVKTKIRQQRVTVTYDSIQVMSDCDGLLDNTAELRGTLRAFDGTKIGSINTDLDEGKSSNLSASSSRTFDQPTSSTSFTVSGNIYEDDDFLEGADDIIGSYNFKYSYPWSNRTEIKSLSGDGCRVKLTYSIKVTDL